MHQVTSSEPASSEGTRTLIIDAAHDCIIRYGIRRTSMQEVARFAGVSRGSVYRYFPDKDSLVGAVIDRSAANYTEQTDLLLAEHSTLTDRVAAVAVWIRESYLDQLYLRLHETEPETVAMMLTSQAGVLVEQWSEYWVPRIDEAKRAGEVRRGLNSARAAEWIIRMLLSIAATEPVTFDGNDPDQVRAFVREFVVAGMS